MSRIWSRKATHRVKRKGQCAEMKTCRRETPEGRNRNLPSHWGTSHKLLVWHRTHTLKRRYGLRSNYAPRMKCLRVKYIPNPPSATIGPTRMQEIITTFPFLKHVVTIIVGLRTSRPVSLPLGSVDPSHVPSSWQVYPPRPPRTGTDQSTTQTD